MFFLKNINKKYLFFFALFAILVFWPKQIVFATCGPGTEGSPCTMANGYGGSTDCTSGYPVCVQEEVCGDSIINGPETNNGRCDNGGSTGDGCNNSCYVESGWYCLGASGEISTCYRNCGNGTPDAGEGCDWGQVGRPGATISNNGNNNECTLPPAYSPTPPGNTCSYCSTSCALIPVIGPFCGDDKKQSNEACDDGNNDNNDGCRSDCQAVETGWFCTANFDVHSACTPVCGDGRKVGSETCDQGTGDPLPLDNNDGCSTSCQQELGWNCTGTGAGSCAPICGDGQKVGDETCDLGPPASNNSIANGCDPSNCHCVVGWNCSGSGNPTTICGDTTVAGSERCDDGSGFSVRGGPYIVGTNPQTESCLYGELNCTVCDSSCQIVPGATSYCGDTNIDRSNGETCDYDTQPAGSYLPIPHGDDGCDNTCKTEPGWTCLTNTMNKNVCIFHCGDDLQETTAIFTEQCDEGMPGKVSRTLSNGNNLELARPPYNGDECTPTGGYGSTCTWCDNECKKQTTSGAYCGDGIYQTPYDVPGSTEQCDDGNYINNDGCTGCKVDHGWTCKGVYSVCTTKCGDGICVSAENCVNCSQDCNVCAVRRPGTAESHSEGLFTNLFEKVKETFIRPKFLINIPGLSISESSPSPAPELPPPFQGSFTVGLPTSITVGSQNYTFTVLAADKDTKVITFSIQ